MSNYQYQDPRYNTVWVRKQHLDRRKNLFSFDVPKSIELPQYALENVGCDTVPGYNIYFPQLPVGNEGAPPGYNIKRDVTDGLWFTVDDYDPQWGQNPYLSVYPNK